MPEIPSSLVALMEKALAYAPIVYNQATYNTQEDDQGYNYTVEYKMSYFPEDCLLFFVPVYSSKEPNETYKPKLYIKTPITSNGKTTYSKVKEYDIIVETLEGAVPFKEAGVGDIIANRMCIFRFRKGYNKAILVNSPLFNNASYSNITATNAEFLSRPLITLTDSDGNSQEHEAATLTDIAEIEARLSACENKFSFGTEDPETALAESPEGTIYIQLEED